jgi:hypothetical protein
MKKIILVLFLAFVFLAQGHAQSSEQTFDPRAKLEALKDQLEAVAGILAEEADTASDRLSEGDIREDEARSVLSDLCGALSYSVDCAYVDEEGVMRYIEPEPTVGTSTDIMPASLSGQDVRHAFSASFPRRRSFDALDYETPVEEKLPQKKGLSRLMNPRISSSWPWGRR